MSVVELVDWPVVRSAEEEQTALFGALNNVAGLRDVVLGRLSLFADDQLLQMWQYAREWGAAAWLIQCAICSEEKRRAQPQSGGRGKTDAAGVGLALCALILYLWTLRVYLSQLERVVMTWEKQLDQERKFVTGF